MERYWTKRTLTALAQGEPELVRQWQSQFGRYLYTGFYYQFNKEESAAVRLTIQTLTAALRELSQFSPEQSTMYQWLKTIAVRQVQEMAAQSGIKPQRPWAWSEIRAEILDGLKRLRNAPLPPDITENTAVMELVQAALAELGEQDRDLLVRRYTRLDTVEHIASELDIPLEKMNHLLYLARHSFRRTLFCLLQSVCADFTEPLVTGGTELLEANLELLLRSVSAAAPMSSDAAEQIKSAVLQAAAECAQQRPVDQRRSMKRWQVITAVAASFILIGMGIWLLKSAHRPPPPPTPSTASQTPPVADTAEKPITAADEEELKRTMEAGMRGDAAALVNILKTGSFVSQITAAHYLGQFGDASAIDPLLDAQQRWFADAMEDNPFARAAAEIEERLGLAAPTAPAVEPQPVAEKTETKQPVLSGRVRDFNDTPLAGALISLQPEAFVGTPAAAVSDAQGRYSFETLSEGLWVVSVRDAKRRIAETSRLLAIRNDSPVTLDFGGKASVAGSVMIDGMPLTEQVVVLSNQFKNPLKGVFAAQTLTDQRGVFLFNGVPTGGYGLFSRAAANRWVLLAQTTVTEGDVMLPVELTTSTLAVRFAATDETVKPVAVSLRYSPDSSEVMAQWPAVRGADDVFEVRGVLPGSYTLAVDYSNGVRLLEAVTVDRTGRLDKAIERTPVGLASVMGRFLRPLAEGMTLACNEPPLRVNLMAEQNGFYKVEHLPAGVYTLGQTVKGQFVVFLETGLFDDQPAALDIDPAALAATRTLLYIYVVDADGRGLANGQLWLVNETGLFIAQPYERGFLAIVPPGRYMLHAIFDGHPPQEQPVTAAASSLDAVPIKDNTVVVRLK